MKKEFKGHQGDVQFKTVKLPDSAKKISNKPIAFGEHSGHCHIVTGDVVLFELNGTLYGCVGSDGAMIQHVHESNFKGNYTAKKLLTKADHNAIELIPNEKGEAYEFGIHKKYNPFAKVFEKVID